MVHDWYCYVTVAMSHSTVAHCYGNLASPIDVPTVKQQAAEAQQGSSAPEATSPHRTALAMVPIAGHNQLPLCGHLFLCPGHPLCSCYATDRGERKEEVNTRGRGRANEWDITLLSK